MILNSPYISGSLIVTSNGTISGSLTVLGGITGAITGSATSASYAISASEASTLQGLGSASFAPASTFNTVSQSYAASSASLSTRVTTNETNISTLTSASSSFAIVSSSYAAASGSLSTRVTNLESTSSTVSQSFASTSGSISGRVTLIEGQYATTGSNNFTGVQYVSNTSNAISFTSTASLYTDGGLRVAKDSFVSGTAYFNNVVVYGTSSIQYITSSQVNFGTNIITVNTDTPAVRFGGLAVFDSGSTGLTGSMLWDSEKNYWVYSNPSGSTYSGGMIISGPRAASLGTEVGTTSCALMMGQGGDHITSSAIFSYGNTTCFYGASAITSTGVGCFSGAVCTLNASVSSCLGVGVASPQGNFEVAGLSYFTRSSNSLLINPNYGGAGTHTQLQVVCNMALAFATCGDNERMRITSDGVVGIGTNAPVIQDGNLVVAGCVGTGQGATCTTAQINIWETTSGNKAGLWFGAVNCANVGVIGSRTATGNIAFQTYCAGWAERMRIVYNGSVGVGTASPYSNGLSVRGVSDDYSITVLQQNTDTAGYGFFAGNSGDFSIARLSGGVFSSAALKIQLNTNIACFASTVCAPSFISSGTICSTGNTCFGGMSIINNCLGIGTATPQFKLDIQGGSLGIYHNTNYSGGASGAQLYLGDMNFAGGGYACSAPGIGAVCSPVTAVAGDLAFYTYTGVVACRPERMRITSVGNVGIGTTSPCAVLHVQGTAALQDLLYFCTGAAVNTKFVYNIASGADDAFILRRNHTTQGNLCIMSWTYQGYVGIGATAPNSLLHICGAGTGAMLRIQNTSTVSGDQGPLIQFMSANQVGNQNFETGYIQSIWQAEGNAFGMRFATKGVDASQSEKMRITHAGKLLIGTATAGYGLFSDQRVTICPTNDGITIGPLRQNYSAYTLQADTNTGVRYALYITNGSSDIVGNISFTSAAVSYNTTSDYRLKEDLKEIKALEKVSAIKVYDFKWKASDDRMDGVLAHELQHILPYAVNGEKDEIDGDGNIKPQGVDYSKIVPVLIKGIQEQQCTICSQAGRIRVLESCLGMI